LRLPSSLHRSQYNNDNHLNAHPMRRRALCSVARLLPAAATAGSPLSLLLLHAAAGRIAAFSATSNGSPSLPDPKAPLRLLVCAADEQNDSALAQVVAAVRKQHPGGVTVVGVVSRRFVSGALSLAGVCAHLKGSSSSSSSSSSSVTRYNSHALSAQHQHHPSLQGGPALLQQGLRSVVTDEWFREVSAAEHVVKLPLYLPEKLHQVGNGAGLMGQLRAFLCCFYNGPFDRSTLHLHCDCHAPTHPLSPTPTNTSSLSR